MKRPGKLASAWMVLTGQVRTMPLDPGAPILPDQIEMLLDAIKAAERHASVQIASLSTTFGTAELSRIDEIKDLKSRLGAIEGRIADLHEVSPKMVLLRVEDLARAEDDFWRAILNVLKHRFATKPKRGLSA